MSTLAPSLKEQSGDCRNKTTIIETMKALHVLVTTVMTDLAALRRTVLEDPTFAVSYQAHLKEAASTARPLLAEALESYDALIEDCEALDEWSN